MCDETARIDDEIIKEGLTRGDKKVEELFYKKYHRYVEYYVVKDKGFLQGLKKRLIEYEDYKIISDLIINNTIRRYKKRNDINNLLISYCRGCIHNEVINYIERGSKDGAYKKPGRLSSIDEYQKDENGEKTGNKKIEIVYHNNFDTKDPYENVDHTKRSLMIVMNLSDKIIGMVFCLYSKIGKMEIKEIADLFGYSKKEVIKIINQANRKIISIKKRYGI